MLLKTSFEDGPDIVIRSMSLSRPSPRGPAQFCNSRTRSRACQGCYSCRCTAGQNLPDTVFVLDAAYQFLLQALSLCCARSCDATVRGRPTFGKAPRGLQAADGSTRGGRIRSSRGARRCSVASTHAASLVTAYLPSGPATWAAAPTGSSAGDGRAESAAAPTARASRALRASALLEAAWGSLRLLCAAALPGGVSPSLSVAQSSREMPRTASARAALLAAAPLCAARS